VGALGLVFISYSRQDAAFVDRLSGDLRARGVDLWIDRERILPGDHWQFAIEDAIERSSALIVVLSQAALQSRWILAEIRSIAMRGSVKVVPVLIEDVEPSDLPPLLSSIQWSDFRASYDDGLASLLAGLGVADVAPSQVLPTPPHTTKGYAFISYAEEDADFVEDLRVFLREQGYSYWDYDESDRDYHTMLFLELEGIIREASATLSVLTETWKRSPWTVKEFFFSQEVGTPVFLLRAKPLGPTLAIAGLPYIDFTDDLAKGYHKLQKELRRKVL